MTTWIGEAASHVHTRTRRRALVAGFYLAAAAAGAVSVLGERWGHDGVAAAGSLLLLAAFVANVVLMHLTHHARTNPSSLLDERGLAERDRAYRHAYRILSTVAGVLLLYAWLHSRTGWGWMPAGREWLQALIVGALGMGSLPSAVIAWTGPDLPAEEPGDLEAGRASLRGVPVPGMGRDQAAAFLVLLLVPVVMISGVGPHVPERYRDALLVASVATALGVLLLLGWKRRRSDP